MVNKKKQQILTQSEKEELDLVAMLLRKRMSNRASSDKTNSTSEEQVIMDEAGPSLAPWMSRP